MKKKGFTLVELLAVIVVLAVIAFIAAPGILKMIEDARIGAFKDSVLSAYKALDYTLYSSKYSEIPANGIGIDELKLKKTDLVSGKFIKDEKGNIIAYYIKNKRYCAYGEVEDLLIKRDCNDLDITYPEIDEASLVLKATTNSVTAIIGENLAKDEESGIDKYIVVIKDGDKKIEEKELTHPGVVVFNNLEKNKTYNVTVTVVNGNDMSSSVTKEVKTLDMNTPQITYVNEPNTDSEERNGYLKSQIAKIDYKEAGLSYYIQTDRNANTNKKIKESCGTEAMPGECSKIEERETLEANTWYKVEEQIELKYEEKAKEIGSIYAVSYDGTNYSGIATGNVSKIDRTNPEIKITATAEKTDSAIITHKIIEEESGVKEVSCKYGETEGIYDKEGDSTESACILTKLETQKEYYYEICATDNVGNKGCTEGKTKTELILNPKITFTSTPTEAKEGFVKEQTATVTYNSTNIKNAQYFVKTEKIGTSSITVNESCGSGTIPGECSKITGTVTLSPNVWYKVSGDVKVTYNEATNENGTIYAITYDGTNYSGAATGTLSKIYYEAKNVTYTNAEHSDIKNVQEALDYLNKEMKK